MQDFAALNFICNVCPSFLPSGRGALHKALRCLFKYILIKKQAVWSKIIKLPKNVGFPAQLPLTC